MSDRFTQTRLTPDVLLQGYASGIFPMAEAREADEIFWVDPQRRGVLPLDGFHISRSLAKRIRSNAYTVTTNQAFEDVVEGCADRNETWINAEIARLYTILHRAGYAHSVEVWYGADLVGGVYGVCLGGAFFGESMFSRATDASKVALAYATHRLRVGGFTLFDTQFITDHLASLGGIEIPRAQYREMLGQALSLDADFHAAPDMPPVQDVLHRKTQTS